MKSTRILEEAKIDQRSTTCEEQKGGEDGKNEVSLAKKVPMLDREHPTKDTQSLVLIGLKCSQTPQRNQGHGFGPPFLSAISRRQACPTSCSEIGKYSGYQGHAHESAVEIQGTNENKEEVHTICLRIL